MTPSIRYTAWHDIYPRYLVSQAFDPRWVGEAQSTRTWSIASQEKIREGGMWGRKLGREKKNTLPRRLTRYVLPSFFFFNCF